MDRPRGLASAEERVELGESSGDRVGHREPAQDGGGDQHQQDEEIGQLLQEVVMLCRSSAPAPQPQMIHDVPNQGAPGTLFGGRHEHAPQASARHQIGEEREPGHYQQPCPGKMPGAHGAKVPAVGCDGDDEIHPVGSEIPCGAKPPGDVPGVGADDQRCRGRVGRRLRPARLRADQGDGRLRCRVADLAPIQARVHVHDIEAGE